MRVCVNMFEGGEGSGEGKEGVKALGFRGIEARERRRRGRNSSSMFVCVHGERARERQLQRRNSSASTA